MSAFVKHVSFSTLICIGIVGQKVAASAVSCHECIDRQNVKIAVVHHGFPSEDPFWGGVNVAIEQGARDMNIDLRYDPIRGDKQGDHFDIVDTMYSQINSYCGNEEDGPVHGILVTLPDKRILEAAQFCKSNGVPVAVFNAGHELAEKEGYLFFGQDEYQTGLRAGETLANIPTTKKFCCASHTPGLNAFDSRCVGFDAGLLDSGKGGAFSHVYEDFEECSDWISTLEESCSPDNDEDWSSIGIFLAGGESGHKCAIEFLKKHPDAYLGASDLSDRLFEGMREGLNVVFGVDQQSYLQGYLPFSFLTLLVTNNQVVQNQIIETGPKLVTEPPSARLQQCVSNDFLVCDAKEDSTTETHLRVDGFGEVRETKNVPDNGVEAFFGRHLGYTYFVAIMGFVGMF